MFCNQAMAVLGLWTVALLAHCVLAIPQQHSHQPPFIVSPAGGPQIHAPVVAAQQAQQQEQHLQEQQRQQQEQQRQQQLLLQQQQRQHKQQQQQGPQLPGSQPLRPRPNQPQPPNAVPNVVARPAAHPKVGRPNLGPLGLTHQRRVEDTQVQCLKTHMTVTFRFSAPFNGFIYPHKQFSKCLLFRGQNVFETTLHLKHGTCGDQENRITFRGKSFIDPVIEHRLMIQWERSIVSEDDSTVIVRCDRPDDFNKTVEWKLGTRELSASLERSQHPGPKMWMEIQKGEGPTAPPLGSDSVFIGDILTLVFTLSDNVYWFDSNIFTCHALDGGQEVREVEWDTAESTAASSPNRAYSGQTTVIENGCSVKPKLFSHFFKEKNTMPNGDLVTLHYGHFKAFRFPTSMRIVLQCDVQVCYKECPNPDPCSEAFHPRQADAQSRRRREADAAGDPEAHEIDRVEMFRSLEVLLAQEGGEERIPINNPIVQEALEEFCYSPTVYYTTVIGLICLIVILIILIAVICLKDRITKAAFFTPTKTGQ